MTTPASRNFTYIEIKPGLWGAYVGFHLIAEAPTEAAVRQLVAERHR